MMETQLQIIGGLMVLLALIHVAFPKYFKWKVELTNISLINRQMFLIHTLFLALVLLLMGILCIVLPHDIIHTRLGRYIALGFTIFWFTRLVVQFYGYSPLLWKGKRFETIVHVVFSIMWFYFSAVLGYIYWTNPALM